MEQETSNYFNSEQRNVCNLVDITYANTSHTQPLACLKASLGNVNILHSKNRLVKTTKKLVKTTKKLVKFNQCGW